MQTKLKNEIKEFLIPKRFVWDAETPRGTETAHDSPELKNLKEAYEKANDGIVSFVLEGSLKSMNDEEKENLDPNHHLKEFFQKQLIAPILQGVDKEVRQEKYTQVVNKIKKLISNEKLLEGELNGSVRSFEINKKALQALTDESWEHIKTLMSEAEREIQEKAQQKAEEASKKIQDAEKKVDKEKKEAEKKADEMCETIKKGGYSAVERQTAEKQEAERFIEMIRREITDVSEKILEEEIENRNITLGEKEKFREPLKKILEFFTIGGESIMDNNYEPKDYFEGLTSVTAIKERMDKSSANVFSRDKERALKEDSNRLARKIIPGEEKFGIMIAKYWGTIPLMRLKIHVLSEKFENVEAAPTIETQSMSTASESTESPLPLEELGKKLRGLRMACANIVLDYTDAEYETKRAIYQSAYRSLDIRNDNLFEGDTPTARKKGINTLLKRIVRIIHIFDKSFSIKD